jgi:cytochrome c oxidase assembly protein subunit 15
LAAGDRARWLEEAGLIFLVHRSFSWLVVLASLVMLMLTRRWQGLRGRMGRAVLAQNGLMLLVFGLGVILAKLDLPPAAQPLHLWLAALLAGSQFIVVWGSFQWLSRPQAAALTPTAKHTAQALPKRPAEEPLHH